MNFLQTMALVPLGVLTIQFICMEALGLVLIALDRENDRLRRENKELRTRLKNKEALNELYHNKLKSKSKEDKLL